MVRVSNILALLLLFTLAACGDDGPKSYIKFMTGGMSFDPDHSHATVSIVVRQVTPLPADGQLIAELTFPDPRRNSTITMPVKPGQLTYGFTIDFPVEPRASTSFRAIVIARDGKDQEIDRIAKDFGGQIDKHDMPRNSDMIPNRERQVEQLNDEGF